MTAAHFENCLHSFEALARYPSKVGAPVIDGWTIHCAEDAIRNIGRPRDLQKMSPRPGIGGKTMHKQRLLMFFSALSHPEGGGWLTRHANYGPIVCRNAK